MFSIFPNKILNTSIGKKEKRWEIWPKMCRFSLSRCKKYLSTSTTRFQTFRLLNKIKIILINKIKILLKIIIPSILIKIRKSNKIKADL